MPSPFMWRFSCHSIRRLQVLDDMMCRLHVHNVILAFPWAYGEDACKQMLFVSMPGMMSLIKGRLYHIGFLQSHCLRCIARAASLSYESLSVRPAFLPAKQAPCPKIASSDRDDLPRHQDRWGDSPMVQSPRWIGFVFSEMSGVSRIARQP